MTGVCSDVITHKLSISEAYPPVQQKTRFTGSERAKIVEDEVDRLLATRMIEEVFYPGWLANTIVLPKKGGKGRVCVYYTDLNKACPRDSFLIPKIDQLVDSTAGNELLSFMDAYSGYNQIQMHPLDWADTAFITPKDLYFYKVMPFGLKNDGATYQRLVNKMFQTQLGRNMEVYIDDMITKSEIADRHIVDMEETFATLAW